MKALLLAGYPLVDPQSKMLDRQIQTLEDYGLEVVVVLGGPESEEYLRASLRLEHCELIYDTNDDQRTLMTNLRSGLHAVHRESLALPVHVPCPEKAFLQNLIHHFATQTYATTDHGVLPCTDSQWPLLITPLGRKLIMKHTDLNGFEDSRWKTARASLRPITSQVNELERDLSDWTGSSNCL